MWFLTSLYIPYILLCLLVRVIFPPCVLLLIGVAEENPPGGPDPEPGGPNIMDSGKPKSSLVKLDDKRIAPINSPSQLCNTKDNNSVICFDYSLLER